MTDEGPAHVSREDALRAFAWKFGLVVVGLSLLPTALASLAAPSGQPYLGYVFNTDDQMVYAAWMRQAMDGQFFFDNRFTFDQQPGQTVHLYFLVLGWIAKFLGLAGAETLVRVLGSFALVRLITEVAARTKASLFQAKLGTVISVLGGGLGFLVWHQFGNRIVSNGTAFAALFGGMQSTDTWQTEGFVFPSMLTTSLFVVSLCLVLTIFIAVYESRNSWKAATYGIPAFALLMNFHSYDVLLIALVLVGLAVASWTHKQLSATWIMRVFAMALGIIPAALWFVHVLKIDPVFQARAATPTYMAIFKPFLMGYLPVTLLAIGAWLRRAIPTKTPLAALGLLALLLLGFATAGPTQDAYWMTWMAWGAGFLAAIALVSALSSDEDPMLNLIIAWAIIGFLAPYFPAMFQRKLAAGLMIPWGLLAAYGVTSLTRQLDRQPRNLVTLFAGILLCGGSILWVQREFGFIRDNVSRTTVQPAFLTSDIQAIVKAMSDPAGAHPRVLAIPGQPGPTENPDRFNTPYIPDINPLLSGLAGAYTYAGHWSETPDYPTRRNNALKVFLNATPRDEVNALLNEINPDVIIGPNPQSYPGLPIRDVRELGTLVYEGNQFLVVRRSR